MGFPTPMHTSTRERERERQRERERERVTSESFIKSVAVGSDLTDVGVQSSNLYRIRTAGHVDAIQLHVDVVQTALTRHEVHRVPICATVDTIRYDTIYYLH